MARTLGDLLIKLGGDSSGFDKMLANAEAKIKKSASRMKKLGTTLTKSLTVPLAAFATLSVIAFSDFDEAMTNSLAIMTNVSEELRKEMETTARTLSLEGVTSARDLAESYFFLASAGLNAKQAIAALPVVQKFATAGNFDMALATDLLTDAQTALGLSSKDAVTNMENMVRVSDAIIFANTQANASAKQFAQALTSDAAAAAVTFGASLETTLAVLSAYASKGKKAAEAGNLFGRAVRLLTKAQRKNGEVFEKFGIKVIDEATGEYRNLIDVIADMDKAFAGLTKPQRDAALSLLGFKALAQKAIIPLLGMSGAMKEYETNLGNAAGTTDKVNKKQLKSFAAQLKITKNRVVDVAITVGQIMLPVVVAIGEAVRDTTIWFRGLNKEAQTTVVIMAAVVAATGPLLIALALFVTVGTKIVAIIAAINVGLFFTIAKFALLASAVLLVSDAFGITETGFLKFVNSIEIGNTTIAGKIQSLVINIRRAWLDLTVSMVVAWKTMALTVQTIFATMVKGILTGFRSSMSKIILALVLLPDFVLSKEKKTALGKFLNPFLTGLDERIENTGKNITNSVRKFNEEIQAIRKTTAGEVETLDRAKRRILQVAGKPTLPEQKAKSQADNILDRQKKLMEKAAKASKDALEGVKPDPTILKFLEVSKKKTKTETATKNKFLGAEIQFFKPDRKKTQQRQQPVDFQEISLRRFSLAGLAAQRGIKKQKVEDKEVAGRLDDLIKITRKASGAGIAAILG